MEKGLDWDIPAQILKGKTIEIRAWPKNLPAPSLLGFHVHNGLVTCPLDWKPLDRDQVLTALSPRTRAWIKELTALSVIGSTNTELVQRAALEDIDGVALLAELQLAGRGRRGRQWCTPLGGSLALSVGWRWPGEMRGLGGLSVVVGLAAMEALEQSGYPGIQLKWPNDLQVGRAKLGGILIELVQARDTVSVVMGIGLNVELTEAQKKDIDQPTTSLVELQSSGIPDRSRIVGALLNCISDFARAFSTSGLAPFVSIFNESHALHGLEVVVLEGGRSRSGQVRGLAPDGGLIISRLGEGDEIVYAGEISLRPA